MARPDSSVARRHRRRLVGRLMARGVTNRREIVDALARPVDEGGARNPNTGNPWSLGSIQNDCRIIEEQWHEETMRELTEHRSRQVAELREARRVAWQNSDVGEVRLNISLEADLLGTKELSDQGPTAIAIVFTGNVSDDDV